MPPEPAKLGDGPRPVLAAGAIGGGGACGRGGGVGAAGLDGGGGGLELYPIHGTEACPTP